MDESQDLFADESADSPDSISATPVEFSNPSVSAATSESPSQPVRRGSRSQQSKSLTFVCPTCKKVLKTIKGFASHTANHKFKEALYQMPEAAQLGAHVPPLLAQIVQEMRGISDTSGASTLRFFNELVSKLQCEEWIEFSLDLSEHILVLVCERTKLMPENQYEETQKNLNYFLNDTSNMDILKDKLQAVCEEKICDSVARRLVFRLSTRLLEGLQIIVTREMRSSTAESTGRLYSKGTMSDVEEQAFAEKLVFFFRSIVKKNRKSKSSNLHTQNACIKDSFIECENTVSTDMFLIQENWFSGEENSIVVSRQALSFFKIVDCIAKALACREKICTPDEVIDELLKQFEALDLWSILTNHHFSEDDSIVFMRDIVSFHL